jgi:hypothetical protein
MLRACYRVPHRFLTRTLAVLEKSYDDELSSLNLSCWIGRQQKFK